MTDAQVQEFLVILAIAGIVCICFALAIGLLVFGVFTYLTRKNWGDITAAIFAMICSIIFGVVGGWAFRLFRDMLLRMGMQ